MHIISTMHGYVITDGLTFVKTFWLRSYRTRQECFYATIEAAMLMETVWGRLDRQTIRGRIIMKTGILRQRNAGQPVYKVERNLL